MWCGGSLVARRVETAEGLIQRLRGLLRHRTMERDAGLLLPKAKQVHTFGMTFPIDVVFCDANGRIVHVVRGMRPNRLTRVVLRSRCAIELAAGVADGLLEGAEVELL